MSERLHDTAKVIATNVLGLVVIHTFGLRDIIDLSVGAVTISYTIWRWRKDARK